MQTQLASQTSILKDQEDELSALNQEHASVSIICISSRHLLYFVNTSICSVKNTLNLFDLNSFTTNYAANLISQTLPTNSITHFICFHKVCCFCPEVNINMSKKTQTLHQAFVQFYQAV